MEAGEKELRQAFEEVTTNNVRAAVDHANGTRKIVRDLEEKVVILEGTIRQYDEKLEALNIQLNRIQAIVYSGGTT